MGDEVCEEVCVICISDLFDGQIIEPLPCGHLYHAECVVKVEVVWIDKFAQDQYSKCPSCRGLFIQATAPAQGAIARPPQLNPPTIFGQPAQPVQPAQPAQPALALQPSDDLQSSDDDMPPLEHLGPQMFPFASHFSWMVHYQSNLATAGDLSEEMQAEHLRAAYSSLIAAAMHRGFLL